MYLLMSLVATAPTSLCAASSTIDVKPHREVMRREKANDHEGEITASGQSSFQEKIAFSNLRRRRRRRRKASCDGDDPSRRRSGLSCRELSGIDTSVNGTVNRCNIPDATGNEALTTCCKTCQTAPIRLNFGGNVSEVNFRGATIRPELTKSEQCTGDDCQECEHKTACFHGTNDRAGLSQLSLKVSAGGTFTSYRVSAHSKCDANQAGARVVSTGEMSNGHVKVYIDGVYKANLSESRQRWQDSYNGPLAPFKIAIEFFPTSPSSSSSVNLRFVMSAVPPNFEQCMDKKNCLEILGDNSDEGFALRNMNHYQKACLERAHVPRWLHDKCEEWRACVGKNPKLQRFLILTLRAAGHRRGKGDSRVGKGSLLQVEDECFDPAVEDPEAWECECMLVLQETCGEEESCYKDKFCAHNRVCPGWKVDNYCPTTTTNIAETENHNQEASLHERSTRANSSVTYGFDDALKGKCAI